ncbi:DUF2254 domain-containing protein [Sphingomonas sp. GC_Shp_3]|uniref:DUF2254 domain-containing protein n=1 Tax=Sphingomonas sp. GC_Shp_3 TaxID=2937383 RepID=UPI00226985FC|nr:DUF2254 domain-containing protein [Sphingomonas sp. GC_Shp_3]
MRRWQWALQLLTRRMWFRAGLFCVFAVALALASAFAGHLISYDLAAKIGSKSVDSILNLLASSMLAVTTFSLTAMVQAYSGATSTITPRAVQLLVDDSTSQNALATFLGSFLFAIVGIIALSTGIYGETGRVILFGGTILVIGLIVITFLRWIEHVTRFGRMADTIARVEKAAAQSVRGMTQRLSFAAFDTARPDDAVLVHHTEIGRITHVDLAELSDVADAAGASLHVLSLPGMLADPAHPLVWTKASLDDQQVGQVREAFTIQHDRAFDHDPRFALVVLGEIASRALSPAVNDPGTAIAVIEAGTRVLATMLRHEPKEKTADTAGVIVPRIAFPDLIEDLFRPIARDGAALIEVGIRLQKALATLRAIEPQSTARCRTEAQDALSRACAAFTSSADADALTRLHEQLWRQGT